MSRIENPLDALNKKDYPNESKFAEILGVLAELYAPYLNLDFQKDVLPNLSDPLWFKADFGVSIKNGREIGMSIMDAYRCLVDVHRTYQFAQGISETVKFLKSKNDKVVGIDAGTGTGILAILTVAAGADEIYALEINHETAEATKDFIRQLKLDERIHVIEADATSIKLGKVKANILVSENLSAGLFNEPQYQIIRHLSIF
jgi:hypothetical protein